MNSRLYKTFKGKFLENVAKEINHWKITEKDIVNIAISVKFLTKSRFKATLVWITC